MTSLPSAVPMFEYFHKLNAACPHDPALTPKQHTALLSAALAEGLSKNRAFASGRNVGFLAHKVAAQFGERIPREAFEAVRAIMSANFCSSRAAIKSALSGLAEAAGRGATENSWRSLAAIIEKADFSPLEVRAHETFDLIVALRPVAARLSELPPPQPFAMVRELMDRGKKRRGPRVCRF